MADENHQDALRRLVKLTKLAPPISDVGASGIAAVLQEPEEASIEVHGGAMRSVSFKVERARTSPVRAGRVTDAQVADEEYKDKQCAYQVFFLTAYSANAGTFGDFYLQFEGALGTTELRHIVPTMNKGQWQLFSYLDDYVGEIRKITVAAATSDGWLFRHLLLLYPRGPVWIYNDKWVDLDSRQILQISL